MTPRQKRNSWLALDRGGGETLAPDFEDEDPDPPAPGSAPGVRVSVIGSMLFALVGDRLYVGILAFGVNGVAQ